MNTAPSRLAASRSSSRGTIAPMLAAGAMI
jgi:hypothetical protein